MIVVDTNIVAYFFIEGPFSDLCDAAYSKDVWCAPLLWRSEYRNVLAKYLRAEVFGITESLNLMHKADNLMWGREHTVRSSVVLECIEASRCSAYDCEFIALARDFGIPLVTTDDAIVRQFPEVAIHLRDFVLA